MTNPSSRRNFTNLDFLSRLGPLLLDGKGFGDLLPFDQLHLDEDPADGGPSSLGGIALNEVSDSGIPTGIPQDGGYNRSARRACTLRQVTVGMCGFIGRADRCLGRRSNRSDGDQSSRSSSSHSIRPTALASLWILAERAPGSLLLSIISSAADHAALVEAPEVIVQELHANFFPVWMAESIRKVLFSRIRFAMAGVTTRNSYAATRPGLSERRKRAWESTAMSDTESCTRTWACWFVGKASMTRLIVPAVPVVWSVAKTKWPVLPPESRLRWSQRSCISPTRMQSGSERSTRRRASGEAWDICPNLALVDDRLLVVVVVLDGVFGGHDVTLVVHVDEVEHGRQVGGFPRSRGAGNDKEALEAAG